MIDDESYGRHCRPEIGLSVGDVVKVITDPSDLCVPLSYLGRSGTITALDDEHAFDGEEVQVDFGDDDTWWFGARHLERELKDPIHRPDHYARFKIEPIYFIMSNNLPFEVGNVIKYVCRHDAKDGVKDLKKAKRYLEMMIKKAEGDERFAE